MNSGDPKTLTVLRLGVRSLRHRNYRLFFMGQGVSLVGTWMQSVAMSWLVYRMTRSGFMLGLVAFSGQIPVLFFSPFAGVIGDRLNRHRIMIIVQVFSMVQAFALAAITISGVVQVWHLIALSFILGVINAFDMPTRQAFIFEMIEDKSDLGNAIALNSGIFNGSRFIGPAIAGVVVALAGEGVCFAINGVSYFAAITALVLMKFPSRVLSNRQSRLFAELKEGALYAFGFRPIRDLIVTVAFMSLVAMSFPVLIPIFAGRILHGGSHTYGFLVASTGAGAVAGVAFLATRKNVLGLGRVISASLIFFGMGLVAFSFSRSPLLSICILAPVGFGMIATLASCNTLVQTIVEEDKRGRVMSLYVMAMMGAAPLGSIMAGSASSVIGAPYTVLVGGILCILGGIIFAARLRSLRALIHPIYRKLGIIPEVAMGMQATDREEV
jgi:MFS family permease